jgi:hypothetical protein
VGVFVLLETGDGEEERCGGIPPLKSAVEEEDMGGVFAELIEDT